MIGLGFSDEQLSAQWALASGGGEEKRERGVEEWAWGDPCGFLELATVRSAVDICRLTCYNELTVTKRRRGLSRADDLIIVDDRNKAPAVERSKIRKRDFFRRNLWQIRHRCFLEGHRMRSRPK